MLGSCATTSKSSKRRMAVGWPTWPTCQASWSTARRDKKRSPSARRSRCAYWPTASSTARRRPASSRCRSRLPRSPSRSAVSTRAPKSLLALPARRHAPFVAAWVAPLPRERQRAGGPNASHVMSFCARRATLGGTTRWCPPNLRGSRKSEGDGTECRAILIFELAAKRQNSGRACNQFEPPPRSR